MLPLEKLLVHLFPLHMMKIPADVSDAALSSLGGNTMHLKSVGLALAIGIHLMHKDGAPAGSVTADSETSRSHVIFFQSATIAARVKHVSIPFGPNGQSLQEPPVKRRRT